MVITQWRTISLWLLGFLGLTLVSFGTYLFPQSMNYVTALLLLFFFLISIHDIRFGMLGILAELFAGVQGYLFFMTLGDTVIPLRIMLFVIWLGLWFARAVVSQRAELRNALRKYWRVLVGLGFIIILGTVSAFLNGNSNQNIFFDVNGWLYWAYAVPFLMYVVPWARLYALVVAAILWIAAKTVILEYIFSHKFETTHEWMYFWLRDYRLAEITPIVGSLQRVFSQDQIFLLLGIAFLIVPLLVAKDKITSKYISIAVLIVSAFVISYSRSLWLGAVLAFILTSSLFLQHLHTTQVLAQTIKRTLAVGLMVAVLSVTAIWTVINIPIPESVGVDISKVLTSRFDTGLDEPAANARLLLLDPLVAAVSQQWLLGAGFGTTVTYITSDPRIVASTPGGTGEYTTFTFEWGYLDILLKIGILGLAIYLMVLYKLWRQEIVPDKRSPLYLGLVFACIALLVVHITTPYINHPLGIGYFLLLLLVHRSYQAHAL